MKFVFLSLPTFEAWDWTNPDTAGIGGSETSHIEMSNRLSQRGHEVYSYAPTPFTEPETNWAGVTWERCDNDPDLWGRPGVWVIYRDPEMVDGVEAGNPAWLICQDVNYPTLNEARANKFTRIVALCQEHGRYLKKKHPYAASKICVSSNGIRPELRMYQESNRNPHRLMYASSPDRGLWYLVDIFLRAREIISDLELHVYYGFDNIEKWLSNPDTDASYFGAKRRELLAKLKSPGIFYYGRTPQSCLARAWSESAIWCHPSMFPETSCITCMDAQAFGAIPVTTPVWAIAENVQYGILIEGNPQRDEMTRARFVLELVRLASDPSRQEEIRKTMMPWAWRQFSWDNVVSQWERWAEVDLGLASSEAAAMLEVA